jgi:hypothetical protein
MKLDPVTARVVLRAILAGMPAEPALWIVEQALDGYNILEALDDLMKKALEGEHEKVKFLCQHLRDDESPPTFEESLHGRNASR